MSGLVVFDPFKGELVTRDAFGSHYRASQDLTVSTTDSDQPVTKLTLNAGFLRAGAQYLLTVSYGWNCNSTTDDFIASVTRNGAQIEQVHRQEPKDAAGNFASTGSNQRHYLSREFLIDGDNAVNNFALNYRQASPFGVDVSIWDAKLILWRVK